MHQLATIANLVEMEGYKFAMVSILRDSVDMSQVLPVAKAVKVKLGHQTGFVHPAHMILIVQVSV